LGREPGEAGWGEAVPFFGPVTISCWGWGGQ
jgi:hypothetical protein